MLDENLHDILTEAFNMGVGAAASVLSELADDEIILSVPSLEFMEKRAATELLDSKGEERLTGIAQTFNGKFNGTAMLLFPSTQSLEMVRLFIKESVSLEMLTEFEEEALCEIGNIILNACLSSMADLFQHEIDSGLPRFRSGPAESVLDVNQEQSDEIVLFLNISFNLKKNAIEGYLTFLLDLDSISNLKVMLSDYIAKMMPGYAAAK